MKHKKIQVYLEPGVPMLLKNSLTTSIDNKFTIELVELNIKAPATASWVVKLGTGELIEGRLGSESKLPFWEGSWLCLAIPVVVHRRRFGVLCPNFVLCTPPEIVPDFASKKR